MDKELQSRSGRNIGIESSLLPFVQAAAAEVIVVNPSGDTLLMEHTDQAARVPGTTTSPGLPGANLLGYVFNTGQSNPNLLGLFFVDELGNEIHVGSGGGPIAGIGPLGFVGADWSFFCLAPGEKIVGRLVAGGGIGPAPVLLGAAGLFEILAKSGISNVPTSVVTGDMGVSPIAAVAITGFALVLDGSGQFSTSAQVSGKVYAADYAPPTPANLTAAVLAMQAAYTDAAGRTPDVTGLGAGNIGGLTIPPGVYKWTTGVTVPNDVTLLGGPSDTWIFQIDGVLSIAAAKSVLLAGGALPQNVVWQVAGGVTLDPTAKIQGTVLSQTAITLAAGASAKGKLLAQTAVTLDSSTVGP